MHIKTNWKKPIKYLMPSLITLLVIGVLFKIQNLYPFGSQELVQVDADYIYIPVLYKIYDLLHVGGSIFYSSIGLGSSIYGSLIIQGSLFNPLNLILYLTSRDNIIDFYSLFIIIKICLISLTSFIYINHKYNKINYFYKVLFSILYAFSGYVLLNSSNAIWLDFVILFPLLVMYLEKLLNEGKELGYIIILSLCLIISAYFSVFLIVFILFYSFINLYILRIKNTKLTIFKLGKSTFIAFLISSFSSIPLLYQIFNSGRFGLSMQISLFNNIDMKSLYFLLCPLFLIIFISLLFKYRSDKRNILKYILLMSLYFIPLIFDPINALMHGGSYWSFPYRYGFISTFILMDASLYYILNYSKDEIKKVDLISVISVIGIIIIGVLGVSLHGKYVNLINNSNVLLYFGDNIYIMIIRIIIIVFVMYLFSTFVHNKYIRFILLSITSLYSILLFGTFFIYHKDGYWLSRDTQNIYNNIDIPKDGIYKVDYATHSPYHGYILDIPTLDNWLHIVPKNIKEAYSKMGYYTIDTKIYSTGGTIFSDWLLNFKYVFNDKKIDDDMFSLLSHDDKHYLYKYNYKENYGVVFNQNNLDINSTNVFEYQNEIYHKLFNTTDNIIDYHNYEIKKDDIEEIKYHINHDGYLYFYCSDYNAISYIMVNDKSMTFFNDYIKNLGNHSKDVNIKVYLKEGYSNVNVEVGFIKNKDINTLNSDVIYKDNKYHVHVEDEKQYLFLPINNIDGIKVYNNKQEVEVDKCLNNFICIKLNKGDNEIEIKYELPLFKMGIVLSIIGLILLLFHKRIKENKILLLISFYLYNILIVFLIIYYYIYSFFKYLI